MRQAREMSKGMSREDVQEKSKLVEIRASHDSSSKTLKFGMDRILSDEIAVRSPSTLEMSPRGMYVFCN